VHPDTSMLRSRRLRGKKEERDRAREAQEIFDQLQIIWCHTDAVCFPDNLVKPPEHTCVAFCSRYISFLFYLTFINILIRNTISNIEAVNIHSK